MERGYCGGTDGVQSMRRADVEEVQKDAESVHA